MGLNQEASPHFFVRDGEGGDKEPTQSSYFMALELVPTSHITAWKTLSTVAICPLLHGVLQGLSLLFVHLEVVCLLIQCDR